MFELFKGHNVTLMSHELLQFPKCCILKHCKAAVSTSMCRLCYFKQPVTRGTDIIQLTLGQQTELLRCMCSSVLPNVQGIQMKTVISCMASIVALHFRI